MERQQMIRTWIRLGAVSGIVASLSYPTLILVPLPLPAVAAVAALFGMSLGIAAVGGYQLIALNRRTVTLQIGAASNVIAGVMVLCMLFIQLSVNATMEPLLAAAQVDGTEEVTRLIWAVVDQVQLAFDVVWDMYISIGTLLIAWNLRRHPRFGPAFGWSGILLAALLLTLNLVTFPTPPDQAGLIDIGPFVGLWAFAMAIQVVRSLKWADEVLEHQNA